MPSSLTRAVGFTLGSIALDTLFKHYFAHVKKERAQHDSPFTQLRQDELLYDEAFNIVKRFLHIATHHSVEEVQAFTNTRTLSPPWVHALRVTVPMSCCDEAATLLIRALGGEEHTSRIVGGTKWWQVREVTGITGEWLTARRDWEEAKKRRKASDKKKAGDNKSSQDPGIIHAEDADDLRCILYSHGGGYYFGSIDLERHCLQRLSRKIKGRVFAVNYRLAPQYPFPCGLQDLVAAYLYLIKPPPDAPHRPLKPSHIVVAGDSAGGGLILALLQVLRDTNQPLPAGGILISPWCDMTHSFASVYTNTATDVIPRYGLSLQKPSALWPPPSEEMTCKTHTGLRQKIRQIVRVAGTGTGADGTTSLELMQDALLSSKLNLGGDDKSSDMPIDVGATVSLPSVDEKEKQTISVVTESGEQLRIDSQVQLYTQNSLLRHPLVSPALSYLGGLPPLFIIASDKEVLIDEVIYSAHKAADPSRFPPKAEARMLYPSLEGIEDHHKPTRVHLQVYDDAAHNLPITFPFSTPGKYCYRAIATFIKHVTGMLHQTKSTPLPLVSSPTSSNFPSGILTSQISRPLSSDLVSESHGIQDGSHSAPDTSAPIPDLSNSRPSFTLPAFSSFNTKSKRLTRRSNSLLRFRDSRSVQSPSRVRRSVSMDATAVRYAGEMSVYYNEEGFPSWTEGMIRERVSTQGVIRPLESIDRIDALHVPPSIIGVHSERAVRHYLEGKALFDQKYAKVSLTVEKYRNRNLDLAEKDITKNLSRLQEMYNGCTSEKQREASQGFRDGLESSTGAWGWAWANERPPPSSIVSRRDTEESRRLARIADQSVLHDETQIRSNSLWPVIANFLNPEGHAAHT